MVNKVIKDGKVAVLISYGFGAGWSTWADDKYKEFALFDSGLVALAERKASDEEVKEYVQTQLGENSYFYVGGWRDIEVEWMDIGTSFNVGEYDGSESFRYRESNNWFTA